MSVFENYLQIIGQNITINDADREIYTKDCDIIRDYIFDVLCEDSIFKKLYRGTTLFGSYSNNVRINYPKEFDIIFRLSLPFSKYVKVIPDDCRPGYVKINVCDAIECMSNKPEYDEIYDFIYDITNDYYFLNRRKIRLWLRKLLRKVLKQYGNRVTGYQGDVYKLIYSTRGLAHTIFAECDRREISIDFVPGIIFGEEEWMTLNSYYPFMKNNEKWFALPKPAPGEKSTRKLTFMMCNPNAEHTLLLNRQNLKVVFRLLKALRNKYGIRRLKSYFITTAFLWEIMNQEDSFWHEPLEVLLVHMLFVLKEYFSNGFLPFFWASDLNLLDVLYESEIEEYADLLNQAYNTLNSYLCQPRLSYKRCASHFKLTPR